MDKDDPDDYTKQSKIQGQEDGKDNEKEGASKVVKDKAAASDSGSETPRKSRGSRRFGFGRKNQASEDGDESKGEGNEKESDGEASQSGEKSKSRWFRRGRSDSDTEGAKGKGRKPKLTAKERKDKRTRRRALLKKKRMTAEAGEKWKPTMYFTRDLMDFMKIKVTLEQLPGSQDDAKPSTIRGLEMFFKKKEKDENYLEEDGEGFADHGDHDDDEDENLDGKTKLRKEETKKELKKKEEEELKSKLFIKQFLWQKKVFSAREIALYAHADYHTDTGRLKQYQEDIANLISNELGSHQDVGSASRQLVCSADGVMLGSMVDEDGSIQAFSAFASKPLTSFHPLANREDARTKRLRNEERTTTMYITAAVDLPTDEEDINFKRMKTCASLGHTRVLCRIRAFASGNFEMEPGLSQGVPADPCSWYYFISPEGTRFRYRLETDFLSTFEKLGISGTETESTHESDEGMEEEIQRRAVETLALAVASAKGGFVFEQPPERGLRVNIFGQIQRATNFEESCLYMTYELVLGDMRFSEDDPDQRTSAITHSSVATTIKKDYYGNVEPVAYFGFPIQMELVGPNVPTSWPTLYFQVLSVDQWQRHTIQGYASVQLPRRPGFHALEVKTWKPVGPIRNQLREFLVGSSVCLKDPKLAGFTNDKFPNKVGMRSRQAGELHLEINIVTTTSIGASMG